MAKKIIDDFGYLDQFKDYTNYFLTCEENSENYTSEKCNSIFIKIFNTILFEQDENRKSKQVAYLVFWLNFIIELKHRQIEEPLLTTLMTIIDKLDLQQLIGFTASSLPMDFSAELNYETRKIFDNNMALTNAQLDMLFAIFERKNMIVSAPTSYGKTGVALKSLLVSLDKGYINNFLVILPTKSLINEYRKSINSFFNDRLDSIVVSEAPYVKPESNKAVFLFTQERFLIFNNNFPDFKFDYAVLDEVQDLINVVKASDNERSVLLAKSISILAACNVPMSFLMPYISDPYNSFVSKFISMDNLVVIDKLFSPTSSIKYLIKKDGDTFSLYDVTYNRGYYYEPKRIELDIDDATIDNDFYSIKYDLYKICTSPQIHSLHDKNLYFCRKQEISSTAKLFANNIPETQFSNPRRKALINYLSDYIDEKFELIDFMKKGIAIHTGDLDTFTKRQIETIFVDDKSGLNHIFCTNTLLKGVNMNANNLFFLAQKGSFDNAELDKKNLLGRVGRLGSCLQGRIFRFFVESRSIKFDTIRRELNASSEPCEFPASKFELPEESKRTHVLMTYLSDKTVKNKITENVVDKEDNIDCFDYFLGLEQSRKVQRKFCDMSTENIREIVSALKLRDYDCYAKVVSILADIYDWAESDDPDLSKRMIKTKFTTRLFYNVAIGTTIKKFVQNCWDIARKNEEKPYVVTIRDKNSVWFLSNQERIKLLFDGYNLRDYTENDRNILIYSTMADISNLIEYKLKIYLQDLYYRLGQLTDERSYDLESFLTHSIVGNKKKIGLKNIGIVDDFAINILCEQPQLFDNNDAPQVAALMNFAKTLSEDDPIKFSIQDVFGE